MIREMQIETTRGITSRQSEWLASKHLQIINAGEREEGTLLHCWWKCTLVQPLWRTVWRFLKIVKIDIPYDPSIPLLDIYPEKTVIQKGTCSLIFIVLFTTAMTRCVYMEAT